MPEACFAAPPSGLTRYVAVLRFVRLNLKPFAAVLLVAPLLLTLPTRAEDPDHVQQLLETGQCPECNLIGADLKGANLERAVLTNAQLSGADFRGATLNDAILSGATLRNALFNNADLAGADLSDTVLKGADLSGAKLMNATLNGADMNFTVLTGANLTGATMGRARTRWMKQCNTTMPNGRVSNLDCKR